MFNNFILNLQVTVFNHIKCTDLQEETIPNA